jgi:subtilisin family serine protease
MASPHAAGAAALYLGRYGMLSPAQVEAAIKGAAVAPGTVSKNGQPITRLDVLPF